MHHAFIAHNMYFLYIRNNGLRLTVSNSSWNSFFLFTHWNYLYSRKKSYNSEKCQGLPELTRVRCSRRKSWWQQVHLRKDAEPSPENQLQRTFFMPCKRTRKYQGRRYSSYHSPSSRERPLKMPSPKGTVRCISYSLFRYLVICS